MYNISFKAYKNKDLKKIHQMINTSAWIWNHCLSLQKRYYSLYGKYINVNKLQKHIAKLRNKNLRWKELNSQSVQEICQRLDESYKRFSGELNPFYGKSHSKESRDKIKCAIRNRFPSVYKVDLEGNIMYKYESIVDVYEDGYRPDLVKKVLKGENKTHGGFYWKYANVD